MKVIITGGSCSGKTTLINELRKRGNYCLDEVARNILTLKKNFDRENIQKLIFEKQIELEKGIDNHLTFLDRGLVDNYAYYYHKNNFPDFVKSFDYKKRYNHVFLLERFPFENDGLREEKNDAEAECIHEKIREAYSYFGYDIIEVPKMIVGQRVNFVLSYIKDLKGGVK